MITGEASRLSLNYFSFFIVQIASVFLKSIC